MGYQEDHYQLTDEAQLAPAYDAAAPRRRSAGLALGLVATAVGSAALAYGAGRRAGAATLVADVSSAKPVVHAYVDAM